MAPDAGSGRYGSLGRVGSSHNGIFRKEGEYWTVGCDQKVFRLKDNRGLGYLAHLLRHPTVEFHVLDLFGGIASHREEEEPGQPTRGLPHGAEDLEKAGIHTGGLGDAGEMLDQQAKVAYRRRLSELREELGQAKARGNVERAERAEEEIDALTRELSRAVGLGGRNRRAASASERARQTITHSIKAVLERIARNDPRLDFLSRCIKTGTFCSYQPAPDFPIAWEFAETITEPIEQRSSTGDPVIARGDRPPAMPVVLEASPFSVATRTPFVGRETERAAIRAAIDRALSGHGSVIMLGGGPGSGKSRLAMEMADYASRVGFRCLVGHCYERDDPFPYLPFVEIIESGLAQSASLDDSRRRMGDNVAALAQIAPSIRRVFPDIPPPLELPPAHKRRHLFQSVSEALAHAARTRSYIHILEDLHWADESTLALLIHLANRVVQLPVVIIGTYRDGVSENNPALVRTLVELIRMDIRPLKLGGLSKASVAQMLTELSQSQIPENFVNLIYEESQGNPFFVEELYRHLLEEGKVFDADGQFRTDIKIDESGVPENVRLVIGRRLERFDENEKLVLAAAAAIGRSFSFQLLAETTRLEVDDLFAVIDKAQQMGIVVPSAEGPERPYSFGHELLRQTILVGISAARQERLHGAVAGAIERLYPLAFRERAGDIADHLLKAGSFADERRLVHFLTLAGESALEAAAFEEAGRSFRSALSHLSDGEVKQRASLLAALAIVERGLERWDEAFANLNEALEIYIGLGDREMIAKCSTELTSIFVWSGRILEAIRTAQRGLNYLSGAASAGRARLLAALGSAHGLTGNWEPANDAMSEALDIASQISDPKLTSRLLGERLTVNYQFFRLKEAAADGAEALLSDAPPWERAIKLQLLSQTLLFLGKLDEEAKIRRELETLATNIGQSYSIARSIATKAWVDFGARPQLSELESVLNQVFKSDPRVPAVFWDAFSEGQLSLVDFLRGDWEGALHHAQASYRLEGETSRRGTGVGILFRQMAYLGDHAGASAILEEKRSWLPRRGRPNAIGSWWMLALVIEGLVVLGDYNEAGKLYPDSLELVGTDAIVLWPIFRFVQTIAGMAAAAARQWNAAEAHFETALHQSAAFPHRLEQAEIRRFHAKMLLTRAAKGDHERALALLSEALDNYAQIGMTRHFELAQAMLI